MDVTLLTRKVSKRNIAALFTMALLSSISFFMLNNLIQQQAYDAQIINIAGKQRMLAQTVAFDVHDYFFLSARNNTSDRAKLRLKRTIEQFTENHNFLLNIARTNPDSLPEHIRTSLLSSEDGVNILVQNYIRDASAFADLTSEALVIPEAFTRENVDITISQLDHVVGEIEKYTRLRVAQTSQLETLIWVASIFVLVITYFLLFKPTQNLIAHNYIELINAKNQSSEFKLAINKHAIVYKIDLKGKITYVNSNFVKFYGYSAEEAIGLDARKICADSYTQQNFEHIFSVCRNDDYWHGESLNKIMGGREHWLDTTIVPLRNFGVDIVDFIVIQNDINERKITERALNELHRVTSETNTDINDKIKDILALGCQLFDLPFGIVSEISDHAYKIIHCHSPNGELEVGAGFDFENTYCIHTYIANKPTAFHYVGTSDIRNHPCYREFALESYIGVPIYVEGKRFGTLNFSSPKASLNPFSDRELGLIQLFGNWIGAEFTRNAQKLRELAQQNVQEQMSEQAQIGAWELDLVNEDLYWSPMTKVIHEVPENYKPNLHNAIEFYKIGESRERIEKALEESIRTRQPYVVECEIITHKGNEIWVAARGKPIFEGDTCVRLVGSFQNINERVLSEQQIKDQKERLDFVMQSTAVGIWDWEVNTGKTVFNERWAQIIGYTLEELQPVNIDTWMNVCHPDDGKISEQKLKAHWSGEAEFYICEARIRHKDGHWVWVLDTGKTVEWNIDGSPKRMIGTHIDISEQKSYEQELNRFNQRMKLAADSAGIGVWELDLVTDELKWDAWMFKLYGVNESDFSGAYQAWEKGLHPEDKERAAEELQQAIRGENKFNSQFRIIWPNGEVRYIGASAIVRHDEHGNPIAMTGVNYDLTERVENENMLTKAKLEAEAGAKAKSEFLASMSHEIRTPMNGVIGMLELMQDSQLDETQQQRMTIAQESAQSLLTLINDILDFSKIEAGQLDLEYIPFNLVKLASSFVQSMALQAQMKGLELVLDTSDIQAEHLIGDPNRIRQILINLVANAIKFTETGEVTVTISSIKNRSGNADVVMKIKDTGIGIPESRQGQLFDAFKQLDASTTRQYGGTGLGLAIVKRLCKQMAGDVSVISEPDKGSEFNCLLRLEVTDGIPSMPQEDVSLKRVLVVDENSSSSNAIKKQLLQWGVNVQTVDSAEDAYLLCQKLADSGRALFDIAIIDIELPQIEGRNLVELLDIDSRFDDMKLVLMTPINMPSNLMSVMELSVHQYVTKPITATGLQQLMAGGSQLTFAEGMLQDYLDLASSDSDSGLFDNQLILLVEDNRINQTVAKGVLEKLNLQCDIAQNGLEALDKLKGVRGKDYQLVLMDVQMPEMDGYQATQAIRAGEAGEQFQQIPIVAMTANAMVGDREKCLAAGMNEYISKPINKDKVLSVLKAFI